MPDEAVQAKRPCQLVNREEQQDRGKEIQQQRGHAGAKEADFTQHRIALLRASFR
jgi:hypothetical protein